MKIYICLILLFIFSNCSEPKTNDSATKNNNINSNKTSTEYKSIQAAVDLNDQAIELMMFDQYDSI